ncbi:hypothetical protein CF327_g1929 [Tilletia walkeri]|uniref:Cytochrome c oxidase subunit n=1 Tax=Tilletia walkeri TaxID=117179 RepID=A0A8X7N8R6_9BASI|nr:hypothetical protein CF327_g1929 [Tilletia walkeri]KAE8268074.1 hypothetical protein A4X09_0g4274 [Tilletia walkeri]
MSDSESSATAFTLQTASFDARFPNQNQNKHCYQNYLDYFRCINAKGEEHTPCKHFYRKYHSLCPSTFTMSCPTSTSVSHLQLPWFNVLTPFSSDESPSFLRPRAFITPSDEWIAKWDEQRENNAFPASLEP